MLVGGKREDIGHCQCSVDSSPMAVPSLRLCRSHGQLAIRGELWKRLVVNAVGCS